MEKFGDVDVCIFVVRVFRVKVIDYLFKFGNKSIVVLGLLVIIGINFFYDLLYV